MTFVFDQKVLYITKPLVSISNFCKRNRFWNVLRVSFYISCLSCLKSQSYQVHLKYWEITFFCKGRVESFNFPAKILSAFELCLFPYVVLSFEPSTLDPICFLFSWPLKEASSRNPKETLSLSHTHTHM